MSMISPIYVLRARAPQALHIYICVCVRVCVYVLRVRVPQALHCAAPSSRESLVVQYSVV